jgi:hypothetical protein
VRCKLELRYICSWTRWLHLKVSAGHPRSSTKKILITSVIRVESCHASNRSNEYEFYVLLAYALGRRFRVIVWLLLCTESMCRFRKSVFVTGLNPSLICLQQTGTTSVWHKSLLLFNYKSASSLVPRRVDFWSPGKARMTSSPQRLGASASRGVTLFDVWWRTHASHTYA